MLRPQLTEEQCQLLLLRQAEGLYRAVRFFQTKYGQVPTSLSQLEHEFGPAVVAFFNPYTNQVERVDERWRRTGNIRFSSEVVDPCGKPPDFFWASIYVYDGREHQIAQYHAQDPIGQEGASCGRPVFKRVESHGVA